MKVGVYLRGGMLFFLRVFNLESGALKSPGKFFFFLESKLRTLQTHRNGDFWGRGREEEEFLLEKLLVTGAPH